jgi:hypothetical protein
VHMDDANGGWKGADTALWCQQLHAATVVGRMAWARVAVELGYAVVRDDGPSGKLGHGAIAGVPEVVMQTHSKRAAEIEAEMDHTGYQSYRARGITTRVTRASKRNQPVGDLVPVGWPRSASRLERSVPRPGRRPLGGRAPTAGGHAAGRRCPGHRQPGTGPGRRPGRPQGVHPP